MSEQIKVKAKVGKKLFYNGDGMFGVYSFYPIESSSELKVDPDFKNFVVTGSCPMMIEGKVYNFTIEPSWNKKYGDGYKFIDIEDRKLTTVEDQQEYLYQVLAKKEAQSLIDAYPDVLIVDYIKDNKIDVNKVKGIKEAKYTKIKNKLSMYDNLQLALVELKDLEISMVSLQKLVDHFGSQEILIQKVKDNIYCLTEVDMFGFIKIDDYAMKRGDKVDSVFRIDACFEHIIKKEAQDGHTWVSFEDLLTQSEQLLKIETIKIVKRLNFLQENDDTKYHFEDETISLKQYYNYEKNIKLHLDRLMENYNKVSSNIDIDKIEKELEITYTSEQKQAITIANQNGVTVINGKAGTGKTTVLRGIIESLEGLSYIACALSGKAAKVLSSKGIFSSTIHRMLGVSGRGQFQYNEHEKLPYDVVFVDEASMVNSYLFSCIVKAIPDGGRIIIVGDNGQLPPIGTAAVFNDLLETNYYPSKELTIVHRQAQKSGILTSANKIRDGHAINGRYDFNVQQYGELKDMVLFPYQNRNSIFDQIVSISEGYYKKHGDNAQDNFQVITALKQRGKNSVKNLNVKLQPIFNKNDGDYLERNGYQFKVGDKIIHNGNNYNAFALSSIETYEKHKGAEYDDLIDEYINNEEENTSEGILVKCSVFNGTLGKIVHLDIDTKEILIDFEDTYGLVVYNQHELGMIELAYAITVHRSQGMGIRDVLVTFDYTAYKMLTRELVYTAITRSSKNLVVICENGALHQAIDNTSYRRTFLKDMLSEKVS